MIIDGGGGGGGVFWGETTWNRLDIN
jgi:hypothetical protein